ncbi:MAG: SMP-30/gluconolactonase/LRE family protein [Acidobacteriota bacterium]
MKITISAMALISILVAGAMAQQKGAPAPPPLACGQHGDAEVICGTRSPEDLEVTPDGKFLIVAQFVTGPGSAGVAAGGNGISLFDPAKKTFSMMTATPEPLKDWGDTTCTGPLGAGVAPHGTSLVKRSNGKWQLYVVNHASRESIEMYELTQTAGASLGGAWGLAWHGCVKSMHPFNDVAALADGSFVATHPDALQREQQAQNKDGKGKQQNNLTSGQPTGWAVRWTPGKGETELAGTRQGYPNGIVATPDGRTAYYNAWTAKEVHKYDLRAGKEVGMVKLDFMPDNLTWTKKGNLLAAGIKGLGGDLNGFNVALVDAGKLTVKNVYDSAGKGALIGGVSVALQMGESVYIGAFNGDRIVKIGWKE